MTQTGTKPLSRKPLSRLLAKRAFPSSGDQHSGALKNLQLKMLRIQQGIWHSKRRAILAFEGFDASGKGGAIRRLTESLDPRGVKVHAIGPPTQEEQSRHYLYRFWKDLPEPGNIAIFDRSWYGRVLVERVDGLLAPRRWREAYGEIREFEHMLLQDGIDLVKIFLAIHPQEQLKRFEARLNDPYKQWKLTKEDLTAHAKWNEYVTATDEALSKTHTSASPWHLIPADDRDFARVETLKVATQALRHHERWMESQARKIEVAELKRNLRALKRARSRWSIS